MQEVKYFPLDHQRKERDGRGKDRGNRKSKRKKEEEEDRRGEGMFFPNFGDSLVTRRVISVCVLLYKPIGFINASVVH